MPLQIAGRQAYGPIAHRQGVRVSRFSALLSPPMAAAAAIVGCAAIRLWYLTTPQATLDGDEATTGVMVRRILDGHLYTYLAGQHYNGAIEQYVQAATLALLPDTAFTLRLTQVGIACVACWLIYIAGARMLATRWQAALAAALFATGPFFNIWKGVRSHGAYGTGQILGLVAIYAALRLRNVRRGREGDPIEADDPDAPAGRRWFAVLGLSTGLALWASWSAGYLILPALVYASPTLWRRKREAAIAGLPALVAGYAPALGWAVAHGMLPMLGGPQPERTPWERLASLVSPVLREFVGVGYRYGHPGWPIVLQYALLATFSIGYVVAVVRRLRSGKSAPTDMLLLTPPTVALLYAASRYTWWTGEPRYLFVAYPALALGIAALVPRFPGRSLDGLSRRSGMARRSAAVAVLTVWACTSATFLARHHDDGPRDLPGCLTAANAWLRGHGVTHIYSDYWTGMPLQFYAGDRLLVGPVGGGRTKFPEGRHVVDADPNPVYLAGHIRDPMDEEPDHVAQVDAALAAHGIRSQRTEVGCVVVYEHLRPLERPWEIGLGLPMPGG
jgi:hypothetical protein